MPLLEYACVKCGPLDVVSKVLAILHLIGNIIAAIGWLFFVWSVFILSNAAEHTTKQAFNPYTSNTGNSLLEQHQRNTAQTAQDLISLYLGLFKFVVCFYEVVFILQVIFLSVLIHGIRTENRRLLFPWMIVQAITIVWNLIAFIIVLALFKSSTPVNIGTGAPINILISAWFLVVVYSLYQQMAERVATRNDINMK